MRTELLQEYERHCQIIDDNNWPRNERRKLKKDIRFILERDGWIDPRALTLEYRWNLCSARLKDGDFTNWDGWEFRSDWAMTFRWGQEIKSPIPKWDGGPCKHIVVLGEQGIGDEILFSSALPELIIRLGHKAIEFQTYPRLIPLIERSFRIQCTHRRGLSDVNSGDAIVALGDLFPFYRRSKDHFPRKAFLKPNPEKVEHWGKWLERFEGSKIGLGWYSRHGFLNPEDLMTEKGSYFDLQYETDKAPKCKNVIKPPFDVKDDFENLFSFVSCLDRVHSCTQTLVHVAGSLGKETKAVIPPKNGEVNWHLWYHHGHPDLKSWPHLVYPNVTVFESIDEFRNSRS